MNILEEVKGAKKIGISGHVRPDGDCIGACMAMYMYLHKALPEDTVIDVILETIPEPMRCISHTDDIRPYPRRQAYDVFLVLDTSPDRTGDALPGYEKAKKTINIDHHESNKGCCDVNYIYPHASSACELVYGLMDKQYVDQDIAMAIYVGIINDTGVMQYSNTAPSTLRIVAELIEYGFDFSRIIDKTFYEKTYLQNKALGHCLQVSELRLDGRVIYSYLSRKTMAELGVRVSDMEGIVSQLRYTKDTEVAIFAYELEPGKWKGSLRASSDMVNVARVCETMNGGGHARAAGCMYEGDPQDMIDRLCEEISQQLD